MKKFYAVVTAMCVGLLAYAQNRNVTLQVDMAGQTVSGNVYVAGDFQGPAGGSNWNATGNQMTQVGTSTIYQTTVSIPDGNYQLKFINGSNWENVPNECNVSLGQGLDGGNGNRWMAIRKDTILPAIAFQGCAPVGMQSITFAVDMSQVGAIDDTVSVAGDFQGWTPGKTRMYDVVAGSDSVYRAVYYTMPNDTIFYKYINGTSWSQNESVPSACEFGGNRRAIVGTSNLVAGINCFGACATCFIPDTFDITIRIDMNGVCGFNDTVDIAGPFNGWPQPLDPAYQLTDANNDGVYEITVRALTPEFTFKARFHSNGATSWEGGNNRVVTFSNDTILPIRCFGSSSFGPCASVPAPSDITFMVDISKDPNFIPSGDGIWLIGDFTSPAWQDGAIQMTPHSTYPGVFETTVTGICPGRLNYKFVNGEPNNGGVEEDFLTTNDSSCIEPSGTGGFNRFHVRPNDQAMTLKHIYNTCAESDISLAENFADRKFEVYPNPFSTSATLELGQGAQYDVRLYSVSGQLVYTQTAVSGTLSIQGEKLQSGVYLLQVINAQGEINSSKIVVQ